MLLQMNKKGVSIMIGYILLVGLAVAMGGILYVWMKSYVPNESLECPEGTSLMVENYFYNCSNLSIINITLRNNGRFDIAGYFIRANNNSNQNLATIDLSRRLLRGKDEFYYSEKNSVLFNEGNENSFKPNDKTVNSFDLRGLGQINSIEIIMARWQEKDNKLWFASCSEESKYKETINCQS